MWRLLKASFVRDLFFAEVIGEPGSTEFEAERIERGVAHGSPAVFAGGGEEMIPERFGVRAIHKKFGTGGAAGGTLGEAAWNFANRGEAGFEFGEVGDIYAGEFFGDECGFGTFESEGCEIRGAVGEGDVVHDDVFVERADEGFADGGVGDAEKFFGQAVGFNFGGDVALRIEERDDAVIVAEVFDVVGEDGVEIADAVGAGEVEIGAIILSSRATLSRRRRYSASHSPK